MLRGQNRGKTGAETAGNDRSSFSAGFCANKFNQRLDVIGRRQRVVGALRLPEPEQVNGQHLMRSREMRVDLRPFVGRGSHVNAVEKNQRTTLPRLVVNYLAATGVKDPG